MKRLLLAGLVVVLAVQLVPYGRDHSNPAVRLEPSWDSAETRELVRRACFACHSNETEWPWYSSVAPISWLVQRDVDAGRVTVNFSEWDRPQEEAMESVEAVESREMPPLQYTVAHPEARLNFSERQQLIRGLWATLGARQAKETRTLP